ncbi:MAG TPA: zinc ribbon domain-containing protein [Candidatus Anaerotruncus excrementipullorum]|uniref:Zinc ribbon domain-containing protein n=1 Tax=Candidatus Anaerotruncus excrementipullorum TaxID=2838465 RepID=A0A9D1WRJ5_9FIRM|nr:zinc ribbon domain-containing protein [Candidatus Anaerotruncus excrementipullorum]
MVCPKCGKWIPKKSQYCMHCGADLGESRPEGQRQERFCILCGRLLPEGSASDVCEHCLHGDATAPDATAPLEGIPIPDLPEEPEEAAPRPRHGQLFWVGVVAAVLLALTAACAGIFLFLRQQDPQAGQPSSSSQAPSPQEDYAVTCAQEMVRNAAYDPSSVHYEAATLQVAEENGVYTVQQTFERTVATGETVESVYIARLTLQEPFPSGYTPLVLQVDDMVLYDYTGG